MALDERQKKERSEYLEKNLKITESQGEPYVFISYASDDWETVFKDAVIPLQQEYGLRVFADKRFEEKNDSWYLEAKRNIRDAQMVLAFVSRNYIKSYPCFFELLNAVRYDKEIVYIPLEQELTSKGLEKLKIELSVKELILEEGRNIKMNAGSSSKDVEKAMVTTFTSIESFLREDVLLEGDLSRAFIEFFRNAELNEKSINNRKALQRTIKQVNAEVFDQSLKS